METSVSINEHRIVVSLTSYPVRMETLHLVIESLLRQTMKADKIVLYLASEQYPHKEADLPNSLLPFISEQKIEVRWCDDLKPHKKYYYAFQDFKDDLVITVDDDITYHPRLIENLYSSYQKFPNCVSAARCHLVTFGDDGELYPYEKWIKTFDVCGTPSMQLMPTGVAGVLYPVHLFKDDLFDKDTIFATCLLADDIWLKVNEVISGIPVVVCEDYAEINEIKESQSETLWKTNFYGRNDEQFQKILSWADKKYGEGFILNAMRKPQIGKNFLTIENLAAFCNKATSKRSGLYFKCNRLERELTEKRQKAIELDAVYHSYRYRVGSVILWLPSRLRAFVRCLRNHGLQFTAKKLLRKICRKN